MSERVIILVIGMHRSGTSVLTRSINLQGAVLPKTLMPHQADNPEGFWESLPIVRFNNKLLSEAGLTWDDPKAFDSAWWKTGKVQEWINQACQLLQQEFPHGDLLVLKDPRMSRLMPVWVEASKRAGFNPRVLLCCRNPLEVFFSLARRNGLDKQRAEHLWLRYMLEAVIASDSLLHSIVHFDKLLDNWRDTLKKAYAEIGLEDPKLSGEKADQVDDFISPDQRHFDPTSRNFRNDESFNELTNETYQAFLCETRPCSATFLGLKKRLNDTLLMTTETKNQTPAEQDRKVILHYHLFKNAGTSLDAAFKENFKGDEWVTKEFPAQPAKNREQVAQWIIDNPQAKCFSSHTAMLPPPRLEGIKVLPVIFLRHPIDRIASAYAFEIKQGGDNFGAVLARNTTMAGYIETRLALPHDRQCRNFQMQRLAGMFGEKQGDEFTRAKMAVEKLPIIGVVEEFEQSLAKIESWLISEGFKGLNINPVEKNVSRNIKVPLEEKIRKIEKELGDVIYQKLFDANNDDLAIYDRTIARK